jgi:hypothetical protein
VNGATVNGNPSAVPEPSTLVLALLALIGSAMMARLRSARTRT